MRKFNPAKPLKQWFFGLAFLISMAEGSSQTYPTEVLLDNGPRKNRIRLVFLSDGYTNSELGLFKTNAKYIADALSKQQNI